MKTIEDYPDLQELLEQAYSKVTNYHQIMYRESARFKSYIEFQKGLLLGGIQSSLYLKKKDYLTLSCFHGRILISEAIESTIKDWLPFMEELKRSDEKC